MKFELPRIYPITDTRMSGLTHAEQTARLVAGGATLIQLREKYLSPREFYDDALAAIEVAGGAKIVINDRVDIAVALRADGVHLGQHDLHPERARALLGDAAVIGYSTHTIGQVRAATELPIDYIAFGPIFGTATKAEPDAPVGLEGLERARQAAGDLRLVAIGGIGPSNLKDVFAAGADSVAMISAIVAETGRITEIFNELNSLAETLAYKHC